MENNIQTANINATISLTLTNIINSGIISLPSSLSNILLNFNYLLNGVPVLSGVNGTISGTAQYLRGRPTTLSNIDLNTTQGNILIPGKYTQLDFSLSGLTGADTVIIYADQNVNIV